MLGTTTVRLKDPANFFLSHTKEMIFTLFQILLFLSPFPVLFCCCEASFLWFAFLVDSLCCGAWFYFSLFISFRQQTVSKNRLCLCVVHYCFTTNFDFGGCLLAITFSLLCGGDDGELHLPGGIVETKKCFICGKRNNKLFGCLVEKLDKYKVQEVTNEENITELHYEYIE